MRSILAGAVAGLLAALGSGAARSQDTSFNRVITLGAGLTNQVGVCNTGLQTIGPAGGTISPQSCAQAYSTWPDTVSIGDGVQLYLANGSSAITFTLARANGATLSGADGAGFCFADLAQHGFTLQTTASSFSGFPGDQRQHGDIQPEYLCLRELGRQRPLVSGGDARIGDDWLCRRRPAGRHDDRDIEWRHQRDGGLRGEPRRRERHDHDSASTADSTIVWGSSSSSAKTEILPQCTSAAPIAGHTFWVKGAKGDEANQQYHRAGGRRVDIRRERQRHYQRRARRVRVPV